MPFFSWGTLSLELNLPSSGSVVCAEGVFGLYLITKLKLLLPFRFFLVVHSAQSSAIRREEDRFELVQFISVYFAICTVCGADGVLSWWSFSQANRCCGFLIF